MNDNHDDNDYDDNGDDDDVRMMMVVMMHWIIVNKDDGNGDDDHGEDDHNGQNDSRVRRPSARLLGPAPASENLETAPERRPPVRPIRFTRPKKSPPPTDRTHKYTLRKNPTPSKKYQ